MGAYRCDLQPNSHSIQLYGSEHISERHRHRFEFNNTYLSEYEKAGMKAVGKNPDNHLVEIIEIIFKCARTFARNFKFARLILHKFSFWQAQSRTKLVQQLQN